MRRVLPFLLAAGVVLAGAVPAVAAPPSSDPATAARAAATWLAAQVNDAGFIPLAADPNAPNLSVSAQAVTALAAAGVGRTQADALLGYLGEHVEDTVAPGGTDDPAALAYLILAAHARGHDPAAFGAPPANLVTRLLATQQPSGLFGAADPTFDGAYRQGLALLALAATGAGNAAGAAWLVDQQCDDGSWTAFRADTSQPCPPVDPNTFTGPDTNSTALAVLGLAAQGESAPASDGVAALDAVRNGDGGWGFLARADQPTDANSTGLVLAAVRTVQGAPDASGTKALLALQAGCDADPLDRGGIAFQAGPGGALVPDALATVQAIPGLAPVDLPVRAPAMSATLPAVCRVSAPTTAGVAGATTSSVARAGAPGAGPAELPRTGTTSHPAALALVGGVLVAAGSACVRGARRRRA
jgi:hypothetical protein